VIDFGSSTVCCGTYQVLGNPDAALKVSHDILRDGVANGAEALALACPLCDYNLGRRQDAMKEAFEDAGEVPVYYFTQLMAVALGIPPEACHFELNRESSLGLLQDKNLITGVSA
jgi:heterodisulfide reductase subunit B